MLGNADFVEGGLARRHGSPAVSLLVALLLCLGTHSAVSAQFVEQVADLAPSSHSGYATPSFPSDFGHHSYAWFGGKTYFVADDGVHGHELWVSDGTRDGTRMVKDICPGLCSGSPHLLTAGASSVGFFANDGEHGVELWRSDGTAEGTFLVFDGRQGPADSSAAFAALGNSWIVRLTTDGEHALVSVPDTASGEGTAVALASGVHTFFETEEFGGVLFFSGSCPSEPSRCLWRTDGSPEGTRLWLSEHIHVVGPDSGSFRWTVLEDKLITSAFVDNSLVTIAVDLVDEKAPVPTLADTASESQIRLGSFVYWLQHSDGEALWRSDGTSAGTMPLDLKTLEGLDLSWMRAVDGRLLIGARSPTEEVARIFQSDGTDDGTGLLLETSLSDVSARITFAYANTIYSPVAAPLQFFQLWEDDFVQAWVSDGSLGGTVKLTGVGAVGEFASTGSAELSRRSSGEPGVFVFPVTPKVDDYHLPTWMATDGTVEGTEVVMEPLRGSSWPEGFLTGPAGGLLFLTRKDSGSELFRFSFPNEPSVEQLGGWEDTDLHGGPWEKSATTQQHAYFLPATYGATASILRTDGLEPLDEFLAMGEDGHAEEVHSTGKTLLVTWDDDSGVHWGSVNEATSALALSSVIPSGANSNHRDEAFKFQSNTYVSANGGLWYFDEDGNPTEVSNAPFTSRHFASGQTDLFFLDEALEPGGQSSLWTSDGTELGTEPLLVPARGPESEKVAVRVWEGWEGTRSTTRRWYFASQPSSLGTVGNRVFFAGETSSLGTELWSVARNEAPVLVADIATGANSGFPRFFRNFGTDLFFVANDGERGEELWKVTGDGTGAQLVVDLNPGPIGSRPRELTSCGDGVCFSAYREGVGRELWRLSPAGVFPWSYRRLRLVADIARGRTSSSPTNLFEHDGALYFSANDGVTGFELWRLSLDGSSLSIFSDGFESGDSAAWQ